MLRVSWKRFAVSSILILVTVLGASNAYAIPPTPFTTKVFVAADLTLTSGPPNSPSETFVVLQAEGQANHLGGTLFLFNPLSTCGINVPTVVIVSGNMSTSSSTGQTLTFTGFEPPDPCIKAGAAMVKIVIGPAFEPPDPCILTLQGLHGRTATSTGETARFVVVPVTSTTTTTSSTTITPPT